MTRIELKKKIPHGYCKVIAKNANVSTKSVSMFLSGKSNSRKIEIAALRLLVKLDTEKKGLTDKIN